MGTLSRSQVTFGGGFDLNSHLKTASCPTRVEQGAILTTKTGGEAADASFALTSFTCFECSLSRVSFCVIFRVISTSP